MDNFTIFFRGTLHVLDLENLNFLNPVKLNGSEFDPLQVVMIRIRIRLDAHKMATFEGLSRQDRTGQDSGSQFCWPVGLDTLKKQIPWTHPQFYFGWLDPDSIHPYPYHFSSYIKLLVQHFMRLLLYTIIMILIIIILTNYVGWYRLHRNLVIFLKSVTYDHFYLRKES